MFSTVQGRWVVGPCPEEHPMTTTFIRFAIDRVAEIIAAQPFPRKYSHEHQAISEFAYVAWRAQFSTVQEWWKNHKEGRLKLVEITSDERAAFDAQELEHRRMLRYEEFVALTFTMPNKSRDKITSMYADLDERDQRDLRPALDAWLLASDITDEVRRLRLVARDNAQAVLDQRTAGAA